LKLTKRITTFAVAAAVGVVPLAGMALMNAGTANAAPGTGITCTAATGSVNLSTGVVKTAYSGCSGNTGGTGKSSGTETSTTQVIKWASLTSTNVPTATTLNLASQTAGSLCPATSTKGSLIGDEVVSGTVAKDTTDSTAPTLAWSEEICAYQKTGATSASLVMAPGTTLSIAAPTGIDCTIITGKYTPATGAVVLADSGCTGNAGATGKTSTTSTATSTVVKWSNATSTTLAIASETSGTACPATSTKGGLVADEIGGGTVTKDTTHATAPTQTYSEELCIYAKSSTATTYSIVNAPGVDFVING
jgi:hypothetical protein